MQILDEYYMAYFYKQDYINCVNVLKYYEHTCINDHVIDNTGYLLHHLRKNKKVVATLDVDRKPKEDEIIIIYGDYPWMYESLIIHNPCYRHFKYFNKIHHDVIEYGKEWDSIDKIYIILTYNDANTDGTGLKILR